MKKLLVINMLLALISFNFAAAADLQKCSDIKDVQISVDVAKRIGVIVFDRFNEAAPIKISEIGKEFSLANSCIEKTALKREDPMTLEQVAQQVYTQLEGTRKAAKEDGEDLKIADEELAEAINFYLAVMLSGTDF